MTTEEENMVIHLYERIWCLEGDLSSMKREVLEIGEQMKELVPLRYFEPKPVVGLEKTNKGNENEHNLRKTQK